MSIDGYELVALSRQRSASKARIAADAAQVQQIERDTLQSQRGVDRTRLVQLSDSTQEANALIDQRTFSWTVLFGLIEKTMPFDVRLVAVAPRVENGNIRVTMNVVAPPARGHRRVHRRAAGNGRVLRSPAAKYRTQRRRRHVPGDVVAYYLAPGQTARAPQARPAAGARETAVSLWRRVYRERRAVLLPLLAFVGLGVALLVLAVGPLAHIVSSLRDQTQIADTNLLRARLVQKQAQDAVKSKTRADQELSRFYSDVLPPSPKAALKVISSLQRTADDAGLVFQRQQLSPERREGEPARPAGGHSHASRGLREHPQVPVRRRDCAGVRHHRAGRPVAGGGSAIGEQPVDWK